MPITSELIDKDLKYIWHPFTQMKDYEKDEKPIIIERGEGIYIWDIEGNRYIDGISSWWVNVLGHSNTRLNNAIINQLQKIEHVLLAGFSHKPAIELAEKLINLMPEAITRVFYSDNGSTAVEVALKMAYQYCVQSGKPQKNKFIALKTLIMAIQLELCLLAVLNCFIMFISLYCLMFVKLKVLIVIDVLREKRLILVK